MGKLNPNDASAPYLQVANGLRSEIRAGRFRTGDKLPSHAAVADDYGVGVGTVKRAFAELQAAGLIVTRQGQGSYVCDVDVDSAAAADSDQSDLRRLVQSLERRVEAIERRLPATDE